MMRREKKLCGVLDTYDDFLAYWSKARFNSVDAQIRLWQASYMKKYPELLRKQVKNYEEQGVDWQEIAKKLFPLIPQRLPLMRKARDNILTVSNLICTKPQKNLN